MEQLLQLLPEKTPEKIQNELVTEFGESYNEVITLCEQAKQLVVQDESDTETMKKAGESRKFLKKLRTTAEKKAKELKEESLIVGKSIDAVRREFNDRLKAAEAHLEKQENFAAYQAKLRVEKLRAERTALITEAGGDPEIFQGLGAMEEDQFAAILEGVKLQVQKRIEEEAEAERQRKAKEEEEARLREENARKDAELAEQQRALNEEKRKREEIEAKARAEEQRKALEERQKAEAERQAAMAPTKEKVKKLMFMSDPVSAELLKEIGSQNAERIRQAARAYNAAVMTVANNL